MGQLHHLFSIGFEETCFAFFCKIGSHLGYGTGRSEPDAFKTCPPCAAFRSTAIVWICLKLAYSLRITHNIVIVPRLKHKQKISWGITHFRHAHSYHSYRYLLMEMTIELILWVCGRNHHLRISLVQHWKTCWLYLRGRNQWMCSRYYAIIEHTITTMRSHHIPPRFPTWFLVPQTQITIFMKVKQLKNHVKYFCVLYHQLNWMLIWKNMYILRNVVEWCWM